MHSASTTRTRSGCWGLASRVRRTPVQTSSTEFASHATLISEDVGVRRGRTPNPDRDGSATITRSWPGSAWTDRPPHPGHDEVTDRIEQVIEHFRAFRQLIRTIRASAQVSPTSSARRPAPTWQFPTAGRVASWAGTARAASNPPTVSIDQDPSRQPLAQRSHGCGSDVGGSDQEHLPGVRAAEVVWEVGRASDRA
jgi:hypothetical protein